MLSVKQGFLKRLYVLYIVFSYSAESQQPGTHMLEEQQEQTEGENLETLDSMLTMEIQ